MGACKQGEVPARLQRLAERLAAWRKTREVGERIPAGLWKSAARLAVECGLSKTATVLGLDYYTLKKHAEAVRRDQEDQPAFVQLAPGPLPFAGECVLDLADGSGARMRIQLRGAEVPDLLALSRSFWGVE